MIHLLIDESFNQLIYFGLIDRLLQCFSLFLVVFSSLINFSIDCNLCN